MEMRGPYSIQWQVEHEWGFLSSIAFGNPYLSVVSILLPRMIFVGLVMAMFVTLPSVSVIAQEVAAEVKETPKQSSFLIWIIQVSGLIGGFIFFLSVYFGTVTIRSFLDLRQSEASPKEIVDECNALIAAKNPRGLVDFLQGDSSYFSQVLLAGILQLRNGFDEARDKLERESEVLTKRMEKSISILAVLGTLGPMIGLLGTLKGMISSFSVIAMSGVALDSAKVAEGISEALVLTFEGVALSVPSIFFYSLFRNRISMISLETTSLAEDKLREVARLLRMKLVSQSDMVPSTPSDV